MRAPKTITVFASALLLTAAVSAQDSAVKRDPRALLVLQHSLAAMGGTVPANSVATGRVSVTAGATVEEGDIRVVTRGVDYTALRIRTPQGERGLVYARGQAAQIDGDKLKTSNLEFAVSSQAPTFPLVIVAAALGNPDSALEYVPLENMGGKSSHHIRFWTNFSANPNLKHLAEFSKKEIWVDPASGLPLKLTYEQRAGKGEPAVRFECSYSDFQTTGGVLYPFVVECSVNGTPWAKMRFDTVLLNSGQVTQNDFKVR